LTNWQERQKEWDRIQSDIIRKVNAPKNHALMMSKTDEYRARAEEYAFLSAAVPENDRRKSENVFEWNLRENTKRSVPVGHMFSGLFTEISDKIKPPIIMRKAKPISDLLARTNTTIGKVALYEESVAMLAQKKKYAKNLAILRPRELSLEDASGLCVRSTDLFQWAVETSEEYFAVKGAEKTKIDEDLNKLKNARRASFGGVFEKKKNGLPAVDVVKPVRRGSKDFTKVDGPLTPIAPTGGSKIIFMTPDELVFSAKQGETVYKPVVFKNSGSISIAYEWSHVLDEESPLPVTISTVADLILKKAGNKSLPREHYLANGRNSIFCMKSKGQILPGDYVLTYRERTFCVYFPLNRCNSFFNYDAHHIYLLLYHHNYPGSNPTLPHPP
jgi:hypothetical protein